jgi:hypothetical protein
MGTLGIARCQNRSSARTDFCPRLIPPSCVSQWEVDFHGSRDHTPGFSRQRNGSYKGLRLKVSDDAGIWYIRWEEGQKPKKRGGADRFRMPAMPGDENGCRHMARLRPASIQA